MTCWLSIQPQAVSASERLMPTKVVPVLSASAIAVPSGDRAASTGPWIAKLLTVTPPQLRTLAAAKLLVASQTTPDTETGPAITQLLPPRVSFRTAVDASTTCSSSGPQQKGPPP